MDRGCLRPPPAFFKARKKMRAPKDQAAPENPEPIMKRTKVAI